MTITSNIFYNLTAWATGQTTAIGTNVASNGIAWRATTAGTTGATAPTGTAATFNDGGITWKRLANIDYTSINNWIAALPATLTDAVVCLLWNTGEVVINGEIISLSGITTSATNTLTVKCAPGESFRDNSTSNTRLGYQPNLGVALKCTASYTSAINSSVDYVFLDGLQIYAGARGGINCGCTYGITITNCILILNNRGNSSVFSSSTSALVSNCLIINISSDGGGVGGYLMNVKNCTIVTPKDYTTSGSGVQSRYSSNNIISNCVVMGFAAFSDISPGGNVINCATDAATVDQHGNETVTNCLVNVPYDKTTFVNPYMTNMDFRLAVGSQLVDKGFTDNSIQAFDIIGTSRFQGANWDIGAWELPQASVIKKSYVFIIS